MKHNAPCFCLDALNSAHGITTCSLCRATLLLFGSTLSRHHFCFGSFQVIDVSCRVRSLLGTATCIKPFLFSGYGRRERVRSPVRISVCFCKGVSSYRPPNEAQLHILDCTQTKVATSVIDERFVRATLDPQASMC